MGKVAVVRRSDGGISFAPIAREREERETQEEFTALCFRRIMAEHPDAAPIGILDESALPQRDEFRNAWTSIDGARIGIDMDVARDIQREKLRALRQPALEALDVEMLRAIERRDVAAQSEVAARKQELRDVTQDPAIDAAGSVEELRAAGLDKIEGGE